ncbi:MAG: ABC transporter permease [Spirochaetes bacterium]|nr:ABC transporter permease [Spirochaetota bacterium]
MKGEKINLLVIAFKNLGRHRVKTILTAIAITIGLSIYIWMDSWLLGMNLDSKRNLVNYETGSSKIYSKSYFEKRDELPMYETFNDYEKILKALDEAGYVGAPRAVFTGSLLSPEIELPFMFIGADPEMEKKVFKYYKYSEPPYKLSKYIFENKILPEINNLNLKKNLMNAYELNFKNDTYYYKNINTDENDKIQNIKLKIEELNNKISYIKENGLTNGLIKKTDKNYDKPDFINKYIIKNFNNTLNNYKKFISINKLKSYEKKLDKANLKFRSIKRVLERDYTNNIIDALKSADYYNFIENGSFACLLGVRGAKDLKVKIGDVVRCSVTIDKKDEKGRIKHIHQLIDITVAGIINSPNPAINGNVAYLPLDILQDNKGIMLEGAITEICIRKKGFSEYSLPGKDETAKYIKNILGNKLPDNLTVVNWQDVAKDYLAASAGDIVTTNIMIGILFLLAIMGIANTMLMAIFERTKEIGMLRANGMRDFDIIKLFLYEAGLIGFIGSFIGIILGLVLDYWIIYYGIDYTNILAETNMENFGYRVVGIFRGAWNFHTIIASPIIATIIAAFTAFFPALKAVKMSIVDALRFE